MEKITNLIYKKSPYFIQNIFITLYGILNIRKRYLGRYGYWKKYYKNAEFLPKKDLDLLQRKAFDSFFRSVIKKSIHYKKKYNDIDISNINIDNLTSLPILSKEELRKYSDDIFTIEKKDAYISKTGGTTGKSLTVRFEWDDFRARMAMLDLFRERFIKGKKNRYAWFSGKDLLGGDSNKFYRMDYINRIRYYSTFHISSYNIEKYIIDFNNFRPSVFVGFPSSLVEIAKYGLKKSLTLDYLPQAIFPTAETVVEGEKNILKKFFRCGVYDQYASSEGAPFITECEEENLHYEPLSGIIEVIDENGNASLSGEILVTSFTTIGTPLIRYKIGDVVTLKFGKCKCGRNTQMVERIEGRVNDFIFSNERGKINLGNISNSVKYSRGIIKFQVIQTVLHEITVKLVVDQLLYKKNDENSFIKELKARLGERMNIKLDYVTSINKEPSGKFRLVKSSLVQGIDYNVK